MDSTFFAGVDACKGGWVMLVFGETRVSYFFEKEFSALFGHLHNSSRVLVDMPIGLLSHSLNHLQQRPCDAKARKLLGKKHSSIFNPPCMEALHETSYQRASQVNFEILQKKLSKQSWNIVPRIREVNAFLHLNPQWRNKVLEAHPELSFQLLNNSIPLQFSKKYVSGIAERLAILEKYYNEAETLFHSMKSNVGIRGKALPDDMADALSLAVLNRFRKDKLQSISEESPIDCLGNKMNIWL